MKKTIILMVCMMVSGLVQAASMTSAIRDEIKKNAELKWPGDYSMQAYQIEKETGAYEKFQAMDKPSSMSYSIFKMIKDNAERKWPADYSMQVYEVEKQIDGWIKINGK